MKKIILLSAIILSCVGVSRAQTYGNYGYSNNYMRQIFSVNYQIAIPLGDSKDFVSRTSFEGVNINWEYFVTHNLTVGVNLGYNNYNKKVPQQVYRPNDYEAVNAAQYRYTQVFPLKAQIKCYFTPDNFIKAYAGVGIGALSAGNHMIIQDIDVWHNKKLLKL